ncbi:MAG: 2-hydroxyacid dehydrogenase [Deltaproteobacteria bacterium]|nr:2-hydroxyacid dehydrogenase [Deltaproteobacteria bacterium]
MPKILLTNYYNSGPLKIVRKLLPLGFTLISLDKPGEEEVIRKISDADYLLVGGRTKINKKILDGATNLKMIQRSGVGLDSIDLDAIRERGIPLYVNEGINARGVAEHTMMLILGTQRRISEVNSMTKSGQWVKHDIGIYCHELYGKTLGLIGLGRIGQHVARMANAFGMRVCYYKRHRLSDPDESELGVEWMDLEVLLSSSDIISLHCPLSTENKNMLSKKEFSKMKQGASLINTSRGGLVEEMALVEALKVGQLATAGLDVFHCEPLPKGHSLLELDNVLLTPHISSITAETFKEMISSAFNNIALFDANKSSMIKAKIVL